MRFIIVTLIFLFAATALLAQYDERNIMTQNAQQLFNRRQYAEAEQAWLQLLQKYPNDVNAISQLFIMYLQINANDKAEKLIKDYRSVLPSNISLEYEIQLDVNQAKLKEAWDKAQSYIILNPKEEYRYRVMAGYFERKGFFDYSIRLYEQGRTALGKTNIFHMEIGNNAFNSQLYDKAVTEYIRFLEAQPGNIYFVSNQLKSILTENPNLISLVKRLAQASGSIEVKEVYAISLSRLGRLKEALAEYENLPNEKLTAFANEQFSAGQDSIAIVAFNALLKREIDVSVMGDILLKSGESHIRMRQFSAADRVLSEIISPIDKKVNPKFERKRFAYQALMMLSDLAQWQQKDTEYVIDLLNEARKLSTGSEDIAEADFRLVGIHFINERFDDAEMILKRQNHIKYADRRLYYQSLIAFSRAKPETADSLINDIIISNPSSRYVNDLMTINILLLNLQPQAQKNFMTAYRHRLNHRDSLAIQILVDLSETTKDEELRILAGDWAVASGFRKWADQIFTHLWQDELLKEYAALQRSKLQTQTTNSESMAQDFLKSNPNGVFSPSFRQILQKSPGGRPNL